MSSTQLKSRKEYDEVMARIEKLLQKSTQLGGFDKLSAVDRNALADLSLVAEQYEDSIPLMPMKNPESLADMLRYKMYEKDLKQKQLASILGISEAFISGLLSGRRKLTIELAKKLHTKLDIDAHFLLMSA
jgi:HTH-type transcriptional regulator/antitoxin HigA